MPGLLRMPGLAPQWVSAVHHSSWSMPSKHCESCNTTASLQMIWHVENSQATLEGQHPKQDGNKCPSKLLPWAHSTHYPAKEGCVCSLTGSALATCRRPDVQKNGTLNALGLVSAAAYCTLLVYRMQPPICSIATCTHRAMRAWLS